VRRDLSLATRLLRCCTDNSVSGYFSQLLWCCAKGYLPIVVAVLHGSGYFSRLPVLSEGIVSGYLPVLLRCCTEKSVSGYSVLHG
jgi:hypothetical protein